VPIGSLVRESVDEVLAETSPHSAEETQDEGCSGCRLLRTLPLVSPTDQRQNRMLRGMQH
jgi:hypothetical protein